MSAWLLAICQRLRSSSLMKSGKRARPSWTPCWPPSTNVTSATAPALKRFPCACWSPLRMNCRKPKAASKHCMTVCWFACGSIKCRIRAISARCWLASRTKTTTRFRRIFRLPTKSTSSGRKILATWSCRMRCSSWFLPFASSWITCQMRLTFPIVAGKKRSVCCRPALSSAAATRSRLSIWSC